MQVILAKLEKLDQLEHALTQQYSVTQVSGETPPALPVAGVTTQTPDLPTALLPDVTGVSPDDVKSVVDAYLSGIAKRDICSHLHWFSRKYTSIVKPILDQLQLQKGI